MEKQILSSKQFTVITLLYSIGTGILIIPASITNALHQDAWIGATIGVLLSLLLVKLYITLANQTPNNSFVEANGKILGKFLGPLTSLGFLSLTFLSAGELLYFIGNFMQTEVMPETPTLSFIVLFTIILVFASYLGIETFARSVEILFAFFSIIFIVFIICISPQINILNIQPIFEANTKTFIISTFSFMSVFSFPLVVLLMFFPSGVNVPKAAQKGFYLGTLLGGVVLISIIALSTLVIGPTNTAAKTFPSYALAQRISIGNFFQRVEVIMAVMWIISIYIRTFIYFYATVIGFGQLLKIKDSRPLILPLGVCMVALAQIAHPNIVHSNNYNQKIWPLYSGLITVLLPMFLLVVAKIRKIKQKENNQQSANSQQNTNNQQDTSSQQNAINQQGANSQQDANNQQGASSQQNANNQQSASSQQNANNQQGASLQQNADNQQSASSQQEANNQQSTSSQQDANNQQSASSQQNANNQQGASLQQNADNQQSTSSQQDANNQQSASSQQDANNQQSASSQQDANNQQSASILKDSISQQGNNKQENKNQQDASSQQNTNNQQDTNSQQDANNQQSASILKDSISQQGNNKQENKNQQDANNQQVSKEQQQNSKPNETEL